MPPQMLTETYYKFLAENHVTNHTPLPILQTKLLTLEMTMPSDTNPSSSTTNETPELNKKPNRKRKRKMMHPTGEKKSKHFLSQGPHLPLKPP